VLCSVPLRGLADVGPQIAEVVAVEDRTSDMYQHAVGEYVKGRASGKELATLIDRMILPDLEGAAKQLRSVGKVAAEQQHLVTDASEYVRLRMDSWRLRADGLRNGSMRTLRDADKVERSALVIFERIRPADQK
jgi:hypothetical protein